MSFMEVNLQNLSELDDGRVAVAFMQELKRATADCIDRPGDKKPRIVTLEVRLEPVVDVESGQCEGANGEFQIKSRVPTRKSKTYSFGIKKTGQLYFSSESPDNVDQTTFDDVDQETGRVNRQKA